jgi:hypothetical protein
MRTVLDSRNWGVGRGGDSYPYSRGGVLHRAGGDRCAFAASPRAQDRGLRPLPAGARRMGAACAPPTDADAELENLGTIASCRVFSAAVGH